MTKYKYCVYLKDSQKGYWELLTCVPTINGAKREANLYSTLYETKIIKRKIDYFE